MLRLLDIVMAGENFWGLTLLGSLWPGPACSKCDRLENSAENTTACVLLTAFSRRIITPDSDNCWTAVKPGGQPAAQINKKPALRRVYRPGIPRRQA
jgi:hypothetical protein